MTPRVDPQERRTEILDATLRCFRRTGYRGTSMDDIVAETGLSKGTLYWYFENKKQLFIEAFDHLIRQIGTQMLEQLAQSGASPKDLLAQLLNAIVPMAGDQLETLSLPLHFMLEMIQEPEFIDRYRTMIAAFADHVSQLIQAGIRSGAFREVDADRVAWALMAAYDGILLYDLTGMTPDTVAHSRTLTDLILAGLSSRPRHLPAAPMEV